ncbi:Oidioi.mRNA.OKI2018_I69.chr2.g5378.t1.cds [Oikopleura dioica]|uniref:Cytochrome b-c1 complex subunit 8 n=1 Tax=Oikopleura dioica TaxID=34765 RepID=A0ABN7T6T0_OIKDI|nr:Oidioi.mRNA.OKI2018_I69.chr2.g5378.t1.cds [Oikopleura dioica]
MRSFTQQRFLTLSRRVKGLAPGAFTNQGIKGYATLERQEGALDCFKERALRRFNDSWWKWVPATALAFFWIEWSHNFNEQQKRKSPADYENDE